MTADFLGWPPLVWAEAVDVEVAASLSGKEERRLLLVIRSSASSARACCGTALVLASVFGILRASPADEEP
jgi:hypothetical protein